MAYSHSYRKRFPPDRSSFAMSEIGQLLESALQKNRATLLRKAALSTLTRVPTSTTLRELLDSEAGIAMRELTLRDIQLALSELVPEAGHTGNAPVLLDARDSTAWPESREEKVYRQILETLGELPMTIGQLAKAMDIDVEELRGYLNWMKKMGKLTSAGRARATRYRAAR